MISGNIENTRKQMADSLYTLVGGLLAVTINMEVMAFCWKLFQEYLFLCHAFISPELHFPPDDSWPFEFSSDTTLLYLAFIFYSVLFFRLKTNNFG